MPRNPRKARKLRRATLPIVTPDSEVALIPLTRGKFATIDVADVEAVSGHAWYAKKSRHVWYAFATVKDPSAPSGKREVSLHRHLLGEENLVGLEVHHVDGDGLSNVRANLQPLTKREHRRITAKDKRDEYFSPFLYVARTPQTYTDGLTRYRVKVGGKGADASFFVGDYTDERLAAMVGDLAAQWWYDGDAPRNFPSATKEAQVMFEYYHRAYLQPKANMLSGYKGVTMTAPRKLKRSAETRRRYLAQLVVTKGDVIRSRYTTDEVEAAWWFDALALHFRGPDAARNFPGEPVPAGAKAELARVLERRASGGKSVAA